MHINMILRLIRRHLGIWRNQVSFSLPLHANLLPSSEIPTRKTWHRKTSYESYNKPFKPTLLLLEYQFLYLEARVFLNLVFFKSCPPPDKRKLRNTVGVPCLVTQSNGLLWRNQPSPQFLSSSKTPHSQTALSSKLPWNTPRQSYLHRLSTTACESFTTVRRLIWGTLACIFSSLIMVLFTRTCYCQAAFPGMEVRRWNLASHLFVPWHWHYRKVHPWSIYVIWSLWGMDCFGRPQAEGRSRDPGRKCCWGSHPSSASQWSWEYSCCWAAHSVGYTVW